MRFRARNLLFLLAITALAGCNPTYLPINPTGIAQTNEVEAGAYVSFGYVGRNVRPLGFRGLVANFGVYFRKGVAEGMDWTVAVDNCSINTALGIRQTHDASVVMRPRIGVGWMSGFVGYDYAWRVAHGKVTDYAAGASALAWVGDAYWTDDPGASYGLRLGGFGYAGAEPRWAQNLSGGVRGDWAPLVFGGKGERETIVDLFGGNRNPYAEIPDRKLLEGWPRPTFAFEPAAWMITGGPALTFHETQGQWEQGGAPVQ
jgi:hypothetical protein